MVADELTTGTKEIWPIDCDCCPICIEDPCACPAAAPTCLDDIIVDLLDPLYENGILSTVNGGVLRGNGIRIQARRITYTRDLNSDCPVVKVHCEGDLLINYNDYVLAGDSLEYDFLTNTGVIEQGRTSIPPWQIGGERIFLHDQGNITICNGYLKTSEGRDENWEVLSPKITVFKNRILSARSVSIRFSDVPIFWFPTMKLDLKKMGSSPVAIKAAWGGFQGSRLGLRYQFLSWNDLDAYLRLDGYMQRGLGIGLETEYAPDCCCTEFYTRSYYAHDISLEDPDRRDRYRFEGTYYDLLWDGCVSVNLMYDKVSDPEMAADYQARDFDLMTAGRTQVDFRTVHDDWIADLFIRARVNSFQTVTQELPSLITQFHPIEILDSGIISENYLQLGYLDYVFGTDVIDPPSNLHSARFEARPRFYRPFYLGPATFTPRLGLTAIAYSNSQSGDPVGQLVGEFGFDITTALYNVYGNFKHVVEPYLEYEYLTSPRVPVGEYLIFDINDAYTRLDLTRIGIRQSLFTWDDCIIVRPLYFDLFTYAFFDTATINDMIPKVYGYLEWQPYDRLIVGLDTAWNLQEGLLDYYNLRLEWTLSEDLAFALEYRNRSRFDWRKADFFDFMLESTRTIDELLHSTLSDQRETALARIFYRFHPDWSIKFQIRHGWNRPTQQNYTEYQADLGTFLRNHFRVHFIYDKRADDHRFSVNFKLDRGPKRYRR